MSRRARNRQPTPPPRRRLPWTDLLIGAAIASAAFVAFWPALDAEFVEFDDDKLFLNQQSFRGFGRSELTWMFTTTFMGHYQPLTWLSSAVDYKISGTDPSSYHRNNLILHALNAALFYAVALHLLRAAFGWTGETQLAGVRGAAIVAAMLFAVHPLRVESVAWATERRDVLSVFFLLGALLAYLGAVNPRRSKKGSVSCFAVSVILLLLSLLSKAWGMTFFVMLLILDVYPLRRLPGDVRQWMTPAYRRVCLEKLPYAVLGLAAAILASYAQTSALETVVSFDEWGLTHRLVQACYGLCFYVAKTVWPSGLIALYELPYRLEVFEPRYLACLVGVPMIGIAVVVFRRRLPALAAAAAFYVVMVAPVLGFKQAGPQLVADRYSYVSCTAWALLAGGGVLWWWLRYPGVAARAGAGTVAGVVLAALFVLTWKQTGRWHDSKTLWTHALAEGPPSSTAHQNLGILLRREGNPAQAMEHYRQAVAIRPDAGEAWFAMANALKEMGEFAEAESAYKNAVPHLAQKSSALLNLGNLYNNDLRRRDDALQAYTDAIRAIEEQARAQGVPVTEVWNAKTFNPTPYLALGIALKQKGRVEDARPYLEFAARFANTKTLARKELEDLSKPPR